MKTKIVFLSIILLMLPANVFAQKTTPIATVREFYQFHFAHEDIFNEREVARRRRFFTPRLAQFFAAELKRQRLYLKKYPDNKPYFEGLSFQPIEFCPNNYTIGMSQTERQTATVRVNFVYGKSSCKAKDGTKIFYKIALRQIGGKWLIDDVVYDNGKRLTDAFNEAKKIK
ncbi:MAG TPA: hypothetical protein VGC97_24685 [Pyrinomonadaceae bacterium]|jgi:hypothetical protein